MKRLKIIISILLLILTITLLLSQIHKYLLDSTTITGSTSYIPSEISITNSPLNRLMFSPALEPFSKNILLRSLQQTYRRLSDCQSTNQNCFCLPSPTWPCLEAPQWNLKFDQYSVTHLADSIIISSTPVLTGPPIIDSIDSHLYPDGLSIIVKNDHHQILDSLQQLDQISSHSPITLIHLDSHSDFHLPEKFSPPIHPGNYINQLMLDYNHVDVIWVLPQWTQNPGYVDFFWNYPLEFHDYDTTAYVWGPSTLTVYGSQHKLSLSPVDKKTYPKTHTIHKSLLTNLQPSNSNSFTILDIDADFFSNTGNDTKLNSNFNATSTQIIDSINLLVSVINNQNIKVNLVFLARSPIYTPPEDIPVIENAITTIFSN